MIFRLTVYVYCFYAFIIDENNLVLSLTYVPVSCCFFQFSGRTLFWRRISADEKYLFKTWPSVPNSSNILFCICFNLWMRFRDIWCFLSSQNSNFFVFCTAHSFHTMENHRYHCLNSSANNLPVNRLCRADAIWCSETKSLLSKIYLSFQDDHLDIFGDPAITGKIGTDISDGKCTWFSACFFDCAPDHMKQIMIVSNFLMSFFVSIQLV